MEHSAEMTIEAHKSSVWESQGRHLSREGFGKTSGLPSQGCLQNHMFQPNPQMPPVT